MPSGDMDPGLVSLRQEVRGGLERRQLHDNYSPYLLSHILFPTLFPTSLLCQFLLRMLTGWVQAIDDPSSSSSAGCPPLPSSGPKADWWPSLCLELGSLLQVNPDILRRHLVCELYNQGLDLRAEEVREMLSVLYLLQTEAKIMIILLLLKLL